MVRPVPDPDASKLKVPAPKSGNDVQAIWQALETVKDPEIPVVTVVEMGMIAAVRLEGDHAVVDMTPTFVGCPALGIICDDIRKAVSGLCATLVTVNVVYDPPWTTDRISEAGRRKLKEFGLAPPGAACPGGNLPDLEKVTCPHWESTDTDLESMFGPTLCRSIHYCQNCLQSFEYFKPV